MEMSNITIYFKNGEYHLWGKDKWDDYNCNGSLFIVKYKKAWVGVYNMDVISHILTN